MSERRVAQGWKWLKHVLGIDGRTERRKRLDAVANPRLSGRKGSKALKVMYFRGRARGAESVSKAVRFSVKMLSMSKLNDVLAKHRAIDRMSMAKLGGADFRALCGPGVYVLSSGESVLYVGSGKRLLERVGQSRAEHIGRELSLSNAMEVLLLPCDSVASAQALENELIAELRPCGNQRGSRRNILQVCGVAA